VSQALIDELTRALAYPKLRRHIPQPDAEALTRWIERSALNVSDPTPPPPARSSDPDDDHLISLAAAHVAVLVSGNRHLLDLAGAIPVLSPRQFLEFLATAPTANCLSACPRSRASTELPRCEFHATQAERGLVGVGSCLPVLGASTSGCACELRSESMDVAGRRREGRARVCASRIGSV